MPFYIRKSVSVGPFRFNLSKSGVGISAGIKGLRVGTGPRGNYVHMGRGGLYYRRSLDGSTNRASPSVKPTPEESISQSEDIQTIETGNVLEMVPANSAELLKQINEKLASALYWPFVAGIGIVSILFLFYNSVNGGYIAVMSLLFVALTAAISFYDDVRRAVVIMYDLDGEAQLVFQKLSDEFDHLAQCEKVWNIDTSGHNADWKRNAGAGSIVTRSASNFLSKPPSVVKTNINPPSIQGGKFQIFFFPDIILVVENGKAGAVSYPTFHVSWDTTIFIEDGTVPNDTQIAGHTWQYVNKSGGPDRRFSNNRQIPKVRYQTMEIKGSGGLRKILHLSRVTDRKSFDQALSEMSSTVRRLSKEATKPPGSSPGMTSFGVAQGS